MNNTSILAVAGAIEKGKFKTTVSKVSPTSREIVYQQDHDDTSVKAMAQTMRDLVQGVFQEQQRCNQLSGKNFPVPIIMGWERGKFFNDIDEVLRLYPNKDLQFQHHKERDKGALICAVDKVSQEMGVGSKIYLSRYSNVHATEIPAGFKPQINPRSETRYERLRRDANNENGGNAALQELRAEKYQEGQETFLEAEQATGRRLKADDDMMDSRFTVTGNLNAGPKEKGILQLWDLRQQFARGYKNQAGIKPDHVMCIKELGVDGKDRPLQNVTEATAYQLLINDGSMTHQELKAPYT